MVAYRTWLKPLIVPMLAGATIRDRVAACVGVALGVLCTSLASWALLHDGATLSYIAAPIGASAVLVFAVPSSPMARPWAVIGGNTVSATVGLLVARFVPDPNLAAGLAVAAAILVMTMLRCLHPPGGAVALTSVLGGPAVAGAGVMFPLSPIAINAVLLVAAGLAYHRFSGHSYPHRLPAAMQPAAVRGLPSAEDVAAALKELGETFDIAAGDLTVLVDRAYVLAARRARASAVSASRADD